MESSLGVFFDPDREDVVAMSRAGLDAHELPNRARRGQDLAKADDMARCQEYRVLLGRAARG